MLKKAILLIFGLLLMAVVAFAQAQADSVPQQMIDPTQAVQVANLLLCIKLLVVSMYASLEALVRLLPTMKSWSPLTYVIQAFEWLINLFKVIIPDKTPEGVTHDQIPPKPFLMEGNKQKA